MAFEFKNCKLADGTEIKGLYEIQPKIFGDARGYFLETYSERDFFAAGLTMKFVQDNQSYSPLQAQAAALLRASRCGKKSLLYSLHTFPDASGLLQ